MQGTIRNLEPMKLVGHRLEMSFSNDKTFTLWNTFMRRRKEILNQTDDKLYNIQLYREGFFREFNPAEPFEKWAAVAVTDFNAVPEGLLPFTLNGGLYAVFMYIGSGEDAPEVYRYILQDWLPANGYELDTRPHFEMMGEKYERGNPDSEEEIWIPVRLP